jgi:hypothetical protein
VLHGDNCAVITQSGDAFEGRFEHGELHGYGSFRSQCGDSYLGDFAFGLPHGRCRASYRDDGEYTGFFTWGTQSGKGEFKYGLDTDHESNAPNSSTPSLNEELQRFKHCYYGYMLADSLTSGGLLMDSDIRVPRCISQRVESVARPLQDIAIQVSRQVARTRREKEKMTFMETRVRSEIAAKKHKVFRQQRHQTKKTMYLDDKAGLSELAVTARQRQRQDRLDFMAYGPPRITVPGATSESLEERSAHYEQLLVAIQPTEEVVRETDLASSLQLMRVALSDVEEMAERQRFLKYDRIWARAEAAFIGAKENPS